MEFIAFPLRLTESGLLKRQQQAPSIVDFLHVMARTPAGSWQACPSFGLRDLFEGGRSRADVIRVAVARINEVFQDMGISDFVVTEMVREQGHDAGSDTYSITLRGAAGSETLTTSISYEQ